MARGAAALRTERDRFERWLELIPHCNRAEEGVELSELAGLFDDSAEAILADVQALVDREYYLPGSFADSLTILIDGKSLDLTSPDHFQRPIRFSLMEALALQLGLQIIAEESEGEREALARTVKGLAAALEAMGGVGRPDERNASEAHAHVEPFAYGADLTGFAPGVLDQLRRGLREHRVIELEYFKPYEPEEPRPRRVAPWALARVHGTWYLLARDEGPGEPRVFRLDRILDARLTDAAAEVPEDLRVEDYVDPEGVYRGDEDDLEVTVRYSSRIARWVGERYGAAAECLRDGSVVVPHRCKSPWWAVGWVLRYGSEAYIAAPERVRALAMQVLEEMDA